MNTSLLDTTIVPSEGPCPAKIMLVGEAPGASEVNNRLNGKLCPRPFIGPAGNELNKMLFEAGIARSSCFITNVCRIRPPMNKITSFIAMKQSEITELHIAVRDKFVLSPIADGIEQLRSEIEACRPNVIVPLGNVALWALTGNWGITKWRGSLLECNMHLSLDYEPKVIPTLHPASVLRNFGDRPTVVFDFKKVKAEYETHELNLPKYRFQIHPTVEKVTSIYERLMAKLDKEPTLLSCDIETHYGQIACIGIAWSSLDALCIPFFSTISSTGYWSFENEVTVWNLLRKILTHKNAIVAGQNFHFDMAYFYRQFLYRPRLKIDTMVRQHALFCDRPKSLDYLSSLYRPKHVYWKDEGAQFFKHDGTLSISEDRFWFYNCMDCVATYDIAVEQEKTIKQAKGNWPKLASVVDFQDRTFWNVEHMMERGLPRNEQRRLAFGKEIREERDKAENEVKYMLGHDINIRSTAQMQKLFYGDLQLKPVKKPGVGTITCDTKALEVLAKREPLVEPLISRMQKIRSLGVMDSTFIKARVDYDGRLRCLFKMCGTDTYRFASTKTVFGSGGNMQNIPPKLRKMITPDEGMVFWDTDLKAADLRVVVWESQEDEMKQMLAEGFDPYTMVAREFYHDPSIEKSDKRRKKFKSLAHGTHYLGSSRGLAARLGLSVKDVESTQKWYFSRFPHIKAWQEKFKRQVREKRYVENIFGYRRYVFDRINDDLFRKLIAWLPQSTVAILINHIFDNIEQNANFIQVLLQMHDSIAGQVDANRVKEAEEEFKKASQVTLPYEDKLIIPIDIVFSEDSWGGCK